MLVQLTAREHHVRGQRLQPRPAALIAERIHGLCCATTVQTRHSYRLAPTLCVLGGQLHVEPQLFLQVRITQIPANGTLFNGSTPLTGTPVVPRTAIAAGNLRYVPVTNYNGIDNFLFRVQDDGGHA